MSKLLFAAVLLSGGAVFAANPAFEPLWLYQGTWDVTRSVPGSTPATDKLQNDCVDIGQFFLCQQTVNGKVAALVTFTPAETTGHYYTQPILPDGHATGRGQLEIDGDHWTYPSKEESNGKTTYYRTTNIFTGKDRIHFEQAESADGKTWKVTGSGDEIRKSPAGTRPYPRAN